jgi:Asp-tRNA(Asn)/Glu-tRNA(Gln) amidotransferase A subunit family amidase
VVIHRRAFLAGLSAAVTGARSAWAQATPIESFALWMQASRREREDAVKACLERIRTLDPKIQAWVQVAPQPALGDGPLAGIPFGAKDIMESRGLSTEYGSPIYKGRLGTTDAAIVTSLRRRGAVLLGKTHTTAFAYRTPAPTRNPRNLEHTPGGSSSGSAAAVAAGMVPFGKRRAAEPRRTGSNARSRRRDGTAVQNAIDRLRRAGIRTQSIEIAELLKTLDAATNDIAFYEGARFHEQRWKQHGARLLELADLVEKGLKMPVERYERALQQIKEGQLRLSELYRTTPVILVPAATGAAPRGLSYTGDPRINAPWTGLGTPAVSIPMPVTGLPLGLQLTANRGEDARVLRAAVRVHQVLYA